MFASKTIAAGILALGTLVAAAPASAGGVSVTIQTGHPGYYHAPGHYAPVRYGYTISPQRVRQILRSQGYRDIKFVDRRGAIYQARAERRGREYRVVISARTGAILERTRLRG